MTIISTERRGSFLGVLERTSLSPRVPGGLEANFMGQDASSSES